MEILWDKTKRDNFIKLCLDSLNKAKKTQIEIRWIEPADDEAYLEVGTRVWGRAVYTKNYKIPYTEIYNLFGRKENEILDLSNISGEDELKLGKYIITKIWTETPLKIK